MNERTTYETTIADKLGQLPVPDRREEIWSRIQDQLDIDMPGGDDAPPAPKTPRGPARRLMGKGMAGVVVVVTVVAVFLLAKTRNSDPLIQNQQTITEQTLPATPMPADSGPPIGAGTTPGNKLAVKPGAGDAVADTGQSVVADPVFPFALPAVVQADSPLLKQAMPPPLADPVIKDSIPAKKPRGVKGMSDADYRISIKKDSVP